MGYWFWRSVKTVFFTCIYYVLLFCSGFIFYPYGEMLDVSRGDKLLVGLETGIPIVFLICSVIVILWGIIRKKKWESEVSLLFSYFIFVIVHTCFIVSFYLIGGGSVNFLYNAIIAMVAFVLCIILGKLLFKKSEKSLESA